MAHNCHLWDVLRINPAAETGGVVEKGDVTLLLYPIVDRLVSWIPSITFLATSKAIGGRDLKHSNL